MSANQDLKKEYQKLRIATRFILSSYQDIRKIDDLNDLDLQTMRYLRVCREIRDLINDLPEPKELIEKINKHKKVGVLGEELP